MASLFVAFLVLATILTSLPIVTYLTLSSVNTLSFQKVEKDLNGIPEDDELLNFQMNYALKPKRQIGTQGQPGVKDNLLDSSNPAVSHINVPKTKPELPISVKAAHVAAPNQKQLPEQKKPPVGHKVEVNSSVSHQKVNSSLSDHKVAPSPAGQVNSSLADHKVAPSPAGHVNLSLADQKVNQSEGDQNVVPSPAEQKAKVNASASNQTANPSQLARNVVVNSRLSNVQNVEVNTTTSDQLVTEMSTEEPDDTWESDQELDWSPDQDVNVTARKPATPTVFALANTDVGRTWNGIPFRERYLWSSHHALCQPFDLSIPHGRGDHGTLKICLYRRELAPNHVQLLANDLAEENSEVPLPERVFGFVQGFPKSSVKGRLIQGRFYGSIFMGKNASPSVYFVEDVQALARLLEHSSKLIRTLLIVMNSAKGQRSDSEPKLNAIVTTGMSLESLMSDPPTGSKVKPSFLALSTGHNSFIISGTPVMSIDEKGRTQFSVGEEVISIGHEFTEEVTLSIKSLDTEYKFRPNAQSILMEGLNVTNLEGQDGPVAVFAVSESLDYGCVVPSPAFSNVRQGGFLCKICAGVDESFRQQYTFPPNSTKTNIYEFVIEILDQVAWIFRSIDWNKDGKYDDIGIMHDSMIFTKNFSAFPENLTADDLENFYKNLTNSHFGNCCLGIMFTMKQFPGDLYAKSTHLHKSGVESGICAIKRDPSGTWNNVIIISGNKKQSSMTPNQLTYLTAHEIGKAFGGSLDATGNPKCDSFDDAKGQKRHFLLWPDVTRQVTAEEKAFSSCSLDNVRQQLDSCRSSCFEITNEPFCGNGIVELGEECDCGSDLQCAERPCCFPRNGKLPCQSTGLKCKNSSAGSLKIGLVGLSGLIFSTILGIYFV